MLYTLCYDFRMRIKLTVAYDGTDYCGWQVQPNGITIQEKLNQAVSDLFGNEIQTIGASRTDSGVHALGNVAVFDADTRMPASKVAFALNERLPRDIVIQQSEEVPADFHPRFAKTNKVYEYRILNRTFPDPLLSRYTYFFHRKLDEGLMDEEAQALVGEHDFTSFASIKSQTNTFVRTIHSISVKRDERDVITIRVEGNGFLYNQVRIIAGSLILVGSGQRERGFIKEAVEKKDREAAGPTAPPEGLTLIRIDYGR